MALLSKAEILKKTDLPTQDLDVPEWGGSVRIKMMTAFERDRFEGSLVNKKGEADTVNVRAKLAAWSIVGEDGKRMFNEKDVEKLGELSANALDRVFSAAQRLNGMTREDIKELEGN